jgi:hypothetical protein
MSKSQPGNPQRGRTKPGQPPVEKKLGDDRAERQRAAHQGENPGTPPENPAHVPHVERVNKPKAE